MCRMIRNRSFERRIRCCKFHNQKHVRGSITVFLTLILVICFSAIFAFLEVARVCGLKTVARMDTQQAADGWMSAYHTQLWAKYRILGWEASEDDFPELSEASILQQKILEGNHWSSAGKNYDCYSLELQTATVKNYQLLTDQSGDSFQRQAALAAKAALAEKSCEQLKKLPEFSGEDERYAKNSEKGIWEILNQLEAFDAEQKKTEKTSEKETDDTTSAQKPKEAFRGENPLLWMKQMKKKGVLGLIMPEEEISEKTIDSREDVAKRNLRKGNFVSQSKTKAPDKLWFRLYLQQYFSNAEHELNTQKESALDYEMEYLIAGKNSDKKNLKSAVQKLILLREVSNLGFLESDAKRKSQISVAALAISTALTQPELAGAVEHAICAVWAYAESVSDVKILLAGGKVLPIKTQEQWHTDLEHLSASINSNSGETQKQGLNYTSYLQILLGMTSEKKIQMRSLNLIEKNTGVRADALVTAMDCDYQYSANSLFWNFVKLGKHPLSGYTFSESCSFGYQIDRTT